MLNLFTKFILLDLMLDAEYPEQFAIQALSLASSLAAREASAIEMQQQQYREVQATDQRIRRASDAAAERRKLATLLQVSRASFNQLDAEHQRLLAAHRTTTRRLRIVQSTNRRRHKRVPLDCDFSIHFNVQREFR